MTACSFNGVAYSCVIFDFISYLMEIPWLPNCVFFFNYQNNKVLSTSVMKMELVLPLKTNLLKKSFAKIKDETETISIFLITDNTSGINPLQITVKIVE